MEIWVWGAISLMAVIIIGLLIKVYKLQKAAKEISVAFAERLATDTNVLIDISSNDKYMRRLANQINRELRKLRTERHRFQQGDIELKNAVTNISHDLRTPLTAICGYLELLEEEEKTEQVERYINIIRTRTEILKELTEELFRYSVIVSSKESENQEEVVVNEILEEGIAAFYTSFKECNIVPQIRICEEKVIRYLDSSALSRVFSNLLNNAVKYSDGDLEINLSNKGKIEFINTTSKLDEIQVGKMFDRFYTVDSARKSTGLGLAIVKTLVEQMDGKISAEYEQGKLKIVIEFSEER